MQPQTSIIKSCFHSLDSEFDCRLFHLFDREIGLTVSMAGWQDASIPPRFLITLFWWYTGTVWEHYLSARNPSSVLQKPASKTCTWDGHVISIYAWNLRNPPGNINNVRKTQTHPYHLCNLLIVCIELSTNEHLTYSGRVEFYRFFCMQYTLLVIKLVEGILSECCMIACGVC
jgi:hypothetical protein